MYICKLKLLKFIFIEVLYNLVIIAIKIFILFHKIFYLFNKFKNLKILSVKFKFNLNP